MSGCRKFEKCDLRDRNRRVRSETCRKIARQAWRSREPYGHANRRCSDSETRRCAAVQARSGAKCRFALVCGLVRRGPEIDIVKDHVRARGSIRAKELDGRPCNAIHHSSVPVLKFLQNRKYELGEFTPTSKVTLLTCTPFPATSVCPDPKRNDHLFTCTVPSFDKKITGTYSID